MGNFDGAEVGELVGLFLLHSLQKRFGKNIGLYLLMPPGHLVLGPDAPLQDQMPPFITHVCQAVLKRTFKLLKRSTD